MIRRSSEKAAFLKEHGDGSRAEAVGDGEKDLLQGGPKLVQIHGVVVVGIEGLEHGVVQSRQFGGRHGDGDTEVEVQQVEALERRPELAA